MTRYDTRSWMFAACLSGLAGYIDPIGFLNLGGFFVSFMSGNSTRLAVGIAQWSEAGMTAGALIVGFVLGGITGWLVADSVPKARAAAVLSLVCILLAAASIFGAVGRNRCAIAAMALAMGAENAVFQRDGEVTIGVTYMTGTLVKFSQRAAMALRGGAPFGWLPYLLLWAGLVLGAIAGAIGFAYLGLAALWIAALVAGILALTAAKWDPTLGDKRSRG